jgi:uncharacterized membrane protein (Fun14 family)
MAANTAHASSQSTPAATAWKSLASSKALWLAFVLTIAGGGVWVYSATTKPESAVQNSGTTPGLGFAGSGAETTTPESEPRLIDRVSPLMMKLGASFMAGFLLAWGIRRFIKWTIVLALVTGVTIYAMLKAGVFEVNYDELQAQVDQGVDWARTQTSQAMELLKTYVPSGAAAIAGMFFGIRR